MHVPIQKQWWSKARTQQRQAWQWCDLRGAREPHVAHCSLPQCTAASASSPSGSISCSPPASSSSTRPGSLRQSAAYLPPGGKREGGDAVGGKLMEKAHVTAESTHDAGKMMQTARIWDALAMKSLLHRMIAQVPALSSHLEDPRQSQNKQRSQTRRMKGKHQHARAPLKALALSTREVAESAIRCMYSPCAGERRAPGGSWSEQRVTPRRLRSHGMLPPVYYMYIFLWISRAPLV